MARKRTDRGVDEGVLRYYWRAQIICSQYLIKKKDSKRRHEPISSNTEKAADKYGFPEWKGQAIRAHSVKWKHN